MSNQQYRELAQKLKNVKLEKEFRIMEVCGTHTAEFFHSGVKDLFPEGLSLIDGPGCPVCVTPNDYLDRAITIGKEYNPIIATFGDMIKVPSSYSSLVKERAEGMDVRIIYAPTEALDIAEENPDREVIFISVGFETTAPTEAVTVLEAKRRGITNFSILPGNKLTPPAVKALLDADDVQIDGFILPGHVCAIIGVDTWSFIPEQYNRPGVVAGFETPELIVGVLSMLDLLTSKKNELRNEYKAVVRNEGNVHAQKLMFQVFEAITTEWRGIGPIPESGLGIQEEFAMYDASKKFPVTPPPVKEHPGCRCGDLLRGRILPPDCPLFGKACTPENAVGPCMVSSEGPCAAYYKYWRRD